MRLVHSWTEVKVWDIIERNGIIAHPCYYLGFGRCSCAACIFANHNQLATLKAINSEQVNQVAGYESRFGKTIKRKTSVPELVKRGKVYRMDESFIKQAMSEEYFLPIYTTDWKRPSGAFSENAGPT